MHPDERDPERRIRGYFLLDTGAANVFIDEGVAQELGLTPESQHRKHTVYGADDHNKYVARLFLPARGVDGHSVGFGPQIECFGVKDLREDHKKHHPQLDGPVIGLLGRFITQFARIEIDGLAGTVELKIDDSIERPKPAED